MTFMSFILVYLLLNPLPLMAKSLENKDLVIAVIDTGIDPGHSDLKNHLWINTKEIPNNQIDDDQNGFIDDVNGWNFSQNNSKIYDFHGHGSHISGLILNSSENSNKIKLMTLKYYSEGASGEQNLRATLEAIDYAIKMKADIINFSGGGPGFNKREFDLIQKALQQGMYLVAAAGNDGANIVKDGFYPASYPLENIITVAAHEPLKNHLLKTSNYGPNIHLSALGFEVRSTLPGNRFGKMSGTSQATAIACGALARLLIEKPFLKGDFKRTKNHLVLTTSFNPTHWGKTQSSGLLNSEEASYQQDALTLFNNQSINKDQLKKLNDSLSTLLNQN